MVVNTPNGAGIENILISLQPDGTYKEFLVHYNVTDQEIIMMNNNQEVDLTNKLTFTELNTNFGSNTVKILIGDNGCVYDVAYYSSTCNEAGHTWDQVYEQGIHCSASIQPTKEGVMSLLSCPTTGGGGNPDSTTNNPSSNSASSNTGNSTAVITCNPKNGPCIEVPDCGAASQVAALTTALGLTPEVTGCLLEPNNCTNAQALFTFHNANLTETAFSKAAAEAICNGGEVDYEDKVIKHQSFINTKPDCVYELLNNNNNLFKDVMDTFANGNAKYKLVFKVGAVGVGNEAETSYNSNTGMITITLSEGASMQSSLEIASTILHEGIHAELKRIILDGNAGANPLPAQQYTYLLSLLDFYQNTASALTVSGNAQHTFMVYYHVDPIANAIRSLDGNLYSLDHYRYFAWTGLEAIGMLTSPQILTQLQFNNYQSLSNIPLNDNHNQECDE